jgi:hypothetical protein
MLHSLSFVSRDADYRTRTLLNSAYVSVSAAPPLQSLPTHWDRQQKPGEAALNEVSSIDAKVETKLCFCCQSCVVMLSVLWMNCSSRRCRLVKRQQTSCCYVCKLNSFFFVCFHLTLLYFHVANLMPGTHLWNKNCARKPTQQVWRTNIPHTTSQQDDRRAMLETRHDHPPENAS